MDWRYYFHIVWTWSVIFLERFIQAFWPIVLVFWLMIFSLYILGNNAARLSALVLGVIASVIILYRRFGVFHMPSRDHVSRRIEHDNNIKHRPISAYSDTFIDNGMAHRNRLWELHRLKTHPAQYALKPTIPNPIMSKQDPYGIRFVIIILAVMVGFVSGWRMPGGFALPEWMHVERTQSISNIVLSAVPPDYTGMDTQIFTLSDNVIAVPERTQLTTSVKAKIGTPHIVFNDNIEGVFEEIVVDNERIFTAFNMISKDIKTLSLKRLFRPRKTWTVEVVPDRAPTIAFNGEPVILPDGAIRLPMVAFDDYGVSSLRLIVKHNTDMVDMPPIGHTVSIDRSIASRPNEPYEFAPVYDLTSHPWAGLPVTFMIVGMDGADQPSQAHTLDIVLPEKTFKHPIAQDLIRMRKKLAWNWSDTDITMVQSLNNYLQTPEKYAHDPLVYLALKTAAVRLALSKPTQKRAEAIISLFWDIAITIENGALDLARQNVRMAQDRLEQMMRNPDATQDDVSQAMQKLRQAMQTMMNEMVREMEKSGMPTLPQDAFDTIMGSSTIDDIISQMEKAMRDGDQAKANEMMAKLQELMDQLQSSQMAEMPQDMEMMQKGQNALKELIDKQKTLRDQTARQTDDTQTDFGNILNFENDIMDDLGMADMPPIPTQPNNNERNIDTQNNKTEQEALRLVLGQLMIDAANALDDIPESMGLAEQEMRGSSDALGQNQPAQSLPHQDRAIEYMEQAQKNLSEQLQQRMKQMGSMGLSMGQGGGQQGMKYDPLGRPYNPNQDGENGAPNSTVEIPDDAARKRAADILKTLRDRSSDRTQSHDALKYFDRLMKWF